MARFYLLIINPSVILLLHILFLRFCRLHSEKRLGTPTQLVVIIIVLCQISRASKVDITQRTEFG